MEKLAAYDYWAYNNRPKIKWPNGAKVAFWVAPNIEYYELNPPPNPSRSPWPQPNPAVVRFCPERPRVETFKKLLRRKLVD